jgi:hypothetical protein
MRRFQHCIPTRVLNPLQKSEGPYRLIIARSLTDTISQFGSKRHYPPTAPIHIELSLTLVLAFLYSSCSELSPLTRESNEMAQEEGFPHDATFLGSPVFPAIEWISIYLLSNETGS